MRRGGRMRGRGRNQPIRQQSIRPLMSEHIQNIDLELELLKQKREMIEQQQLMLESQKMYDQQRLYSDKPRYFDQDPYDCPGPSRERNFVRFYEDPVAEDYIPLSSGRKRAANAGCPRGSSPKRFGSRRDSVVQSFGSRLGPEPTPQYDRSGSASRRPKRKYTPTDDAEEDCILRPDCPPTPKVRGRLGFASGHIMKQMRENLSDNAKLNYVMYNNPYMGMMKHALLERIKTVMMNKAVVHGDDVLVMYRKKYPVETDASFLKSVKKDIHGKTVNVLPVNDDIVGAPINPANYIKNEMGKVVDAELNEIIRKLEIIHNPKLTEAQKKKSLAKESVEVTSIQDDENDTEEVKLWKKEVHKKIRQKLPKMLIKNIPLILKFLSFDLVYINTWTALMAKTKENDEGGVHKLEVGIETEPAFAPRFCAKVRGIPKLPPKIRQFLEPFKPIWVKKNKMVRNVVFVSFRDRAGLEQLMKKNGHDFGECYLRISCSSLKKESNEKTVKATPKKARLTARSQAFKAAKEKADKSDDTFNISADLDNQIDDLLSSIRQSEEESDLNEAMIVDPDVKTEESDVKLSESNDNVITEAQDVQSADVDEINEQNDDTAQGDAKLSNTVSETVDAVEQNVGEEKCTEETTVDNESQNKE